MFATFLSVFFWILDVVFIPVIIDRRGGLGQTRAVARAGLQLAYGMAEAESQAALEILRMVSSPREISRGRAAFGRVCQSCQGRDKELSRGSLQPPSCTEDIGAAWKSRSCFGQHEGWAQSPCLPILSVSRAAHCTHHTGLFAVPLWVARASNCSSTIVVAALV